MSVTTDRLPGEAELVDSVELEYAWRLVEQFSHLVRDSGTEDEQRAVDLITARLKEWGVPHTVNRPELLISLPVEASLTVDGVDYAAKTPSMAKSTEAAGVEAPLVYEPTGFAKSVADIFAPAARGTADVAGKFVMCEGQPMGGKLAQFQERGALGAVFIAPGSRIHEGIVTTIWGSPDLSSWDRKPQIPVVSVNRDDGERIIKALSSGARPARMVARHDERWRPIPVVVAEIRGSLEPERFALVHGHVDSWHVGVGDNATGDGTLLEVARVMQLNRSRLLRSVRVCWWSGHSHGRYAGSTWYAQQYARDIEANCIAHVNCDSPGCREADTYEGVTSMSELADFVVSAVADFAGAPASTSPPVRGGDISFSNLGVSNCFMLSSNMPAALRQQRGYYAVGGCGGNLEWHHEDDTLEVADKDNLLRDMRLYAGAAFRMANSPLHPLDLRSTAREVGASLRDYQLKLGDLYDFDSLVGMADDLEAALGRFYSRAAQAAVDVQTARPYNDALVSMGRRLVRLLYCKDGRYRQDPADHSFPIPELGAATAAKGRVPDGVLRTELARVGNRIEAALAQVTKTANELVP